MTIDTSALLADAAAIKAAEAKLEIDIAALNAPTSQVKPTGTFHIQSGVSSLTNGLIYYGFDTGQGSVKNLVPGANADVWNTLPPTISTPFGSALGWLGQSADYPAIPGAYGVVALVGTLDGTDADSALTKASQLKAGPAGMGFSFACAVSKTGASAFQAQIFGRPAFANETAPFSNWLIQENTANQFYVTVNNNGTQALVGSPSASVSPGVFTSLACTLVNDTAGSATATFYVNGVSSGSTSGIGMVNSNINIGTDSETQVMHGAALHVNVSPQRSFLNFLGAIYYGGAWNRQLSATEVLTLHNNPYVFLGP